MLHEEWREALGVRWGDRRLATVLRPAAGSGYVVLIGNSELVAASALPLAAGQRVVVVGGAVVRVLSGVVTVVV